MLEAPFYVIRSGAGLIQITSNSNLLSSLVEMVSKGIIDVPLKNPFLTMVANLSRKTINLTNRIYVHEGFDVPKRTISFSDTAEESLNTIPHYK